MTSRHGSLAGAPPGTPAEVRAYETTRWRRPDQKLVDRLERRVLSAWLALLGEEGGREGVESVLDVPCGYGRLTGLLARYLAEQGMLVSADVADAMVRRARERVTGSGNVDTRPPTAPADGAPRAPADGAPRAPGGSEAHRVDHGFCTADLTALPFPDGAFDGAVVFRVLHHFARAAPRRRALAETARVTRRWAILSVYGTNPLHAALRRIQGRAPRKLGRGLFERELAESGFRIVARRRILPGLHAQTLYLVRPPGAAPGGAEAEAESGGAGRSAPAAR